LAERLKATWQRNKVRDAEGMPLRSAEERWGADAFTSGGSRRVETKE
jgi:hypothetical protein